MPCAAISHSPTSSSVSKRGSLASGVWVMKSASGPYLSFHARHCAFARHQRHCFSPGFSSPLPSHASLAAGRRVFSAQSSKLSALVSQVSGSLWMRGWTMLMRTVLMSSVVLNSSHAPSAYSIIWMLSTGLTGTPAPYLKSIT